MIEVAYIAVRLFQRSLRTATIGQVAIVLNLGKGLIFIFWPDLAGF